MSQEKTAESDTIVDRLWHEVKELFGTLVVFVPIYLVFTTFAFELRSIPSESMVPNLLVGDRVAVSKYAYGYSKNSVPFGLGNLLPIGDGKILARMPKRGDVIVFHHTHDDKVMIKRLLGLPGDHIQVRNGEVFLNGEQLDRSGGKWVRYQTFKDAQRVRAAEQVERHSDGTAYLTHDIEGKTGLSNTKTFVVPEGHLFFMGDNRDNSMDSRDESGHCPPINGVIDSGACELSRGVTRNEASIGFVPVENLIGRAETVLFTLNFCGRYEEGCPQGRVWKPL